MSKQQHDQDEPQAPKGADASRSDKEESTPAPSKTSEASSPDASPPAASGGKSQRARSRRGNGKRGNDKAAAADGDAPKAPETPAKAPETPAKAPGERTDTGTGPGTTAGADKPSTQSATPPGGSSKTPGGAGGGSGRTPSSSAGGNGSGDTGKGLGLAALILVIVLAVAVAAFGWWGWQRLEDQQQRLDQADANAEAIADLESRFEASESERQSALDEAQASLRNEFENYRGEVDETLDRVLDELSSQQDTDERDWLHAEAAYLLRLANQRLQLERDVKGAAALLRTADERLREADNPALVPVRREIASELAELDSVPRVDRAGLYLAINAQQEQLAKLPLTQDIEEIAAQPGDDTPPSGGWQQQLGRFASELKDLVTVRRHDQELEALITPQQESYLRQNARLVLEQAQLALLREEPELYQASLDKAIELVRGYYATDREAVETTLERLSELREASIRPELPDISGSQQALATFIERRFEADDGEGDEA